LANVTVSVPEELKRKMVNAKTVNWSEVARQAFEDRLRQRRMVEAAAAMDKLREATKTTTGRPSWSGVREIRKWRNKSTES
jgi:hypothetical protein